MKKYYLFILLVSVVPFAWAQTASYAQNEPVVAAEAPASGIDLIRQALQASDVAGTGSSSRVRVSSATAVSAPSASLPASSVAGAASSPVVSAPAAAPETTQAAAASVSPSSTTVSPAGRRRARRTAVSAPRTAPATTASTQTAVSTVTAASAPSDALTEPASQPAPAPGTATDMEQASREAIAQEELDYAARMLQQAREEMSSGRYIPPAASEAAYAAPAVQAKGPFDPNDYRPGVEWQTSNTTHFTIYTQKRDSGIGSSNMGMIFESAYSTLRRNIPWMMSDKVRVFVYQDHNSYLKHEPNAKAWMRAMAYPTRGEIVVYDEPGKQQELKEVFTHELVHIFTQKYFDSHHTGRLMTPEWLDEGLAVYMEDQAYNGRQGGPWAHDFKTLNFQRSKETQLPDFSSTNMFGGARSFATGQRVGGEPLYFMPFDQFMQEGSLASMEGRGKTQDWYFQAYAMVRFLLNPSGGMSPSNRMQFEQFTRLIAQGEQVRDPRSGFPVRGANGQPVYKPYPVENALGRAYRYNSAANFEDAFWRWADGAR